MTIGFQEWGEKRLKRSTNLKL
uniref:Uncharacterized protein n=1 Tax=Anguilla anguilla TaxID=7936 RepID=A0A0E9TJK2_ANGAN